MLNTVYSSRVQRTSRILISLPFDLPTTGWKRIFTNSMRHWCCRTIISTEQHQGLRWKGNPIRISHEMRQFRITSIIDSSIHAFKFSQPVFQLSNLPAQQSLFRVYCRRAVNFQVIMYILSRFLRLKKDGSSQTLHI